MNNNKLLKWLIVGAILVLISFIGYYIKSIYEFAVGTQKDYRQRIDMEQAFITNLEFNGEIIHKSLSSNFYKGHYIFIRTFDLDLQNELNHCCKSYSVIEHNVIAIMMSKEEYDTFFEGNIVCKKKGDIKIHKIKKR